MGLHTASRLDRLAIGGEAKALKAGPTQHRSPLMLGLAVIIFSMLAADAGCALAIPPRACSGEAPARHRSELIAVLRLHTSLRPFTIRWKIYRFPRYWWTRDRKAKAFVPRSLEEQPPCNERLQSGDFRFSAKIPTILPILHAVRARFPPQLDAITTLAKAGGLAGRAASVCRTKSQQCNQ